MVSALVKMAPEVVPLSRLHIVCRRVVDEVFGGNCGYGANNLVQACEHRLSYTYIVPVNNAMVAPI